MMQFRVNGATGTFLFKNVNEGHPGLSLHFNRYFPRQGWSVPDVIRELTIFLTLSLTQKFSEFA